MCGSKFVSNEKIGMEDDVPDLSIAEYSTDVWFCQTEKVSSSYCDYVVSQAQEEAE